MEEWIKYPTEDGYWRFTCGNAQNIYMVCLGKAFLHGDKDGIELNKMPLGWWIKVPDAPAAPKPILPYEKKVILTATVTRYPTNRYVANIFIDKQESPITSGSFDSETKAIGYCDIFGIQPTFWNWDLVK